MDLQTCLKTTLRNKYRKLNEAHLENSLLPSGFCYRDLKHKFVLPAEHQHELSYVDSNSPYTRVTLPTVPLTDILSCDCKHESSKRTVITVGVSGAGTTTAVQMCALEWAEGKEYLHIHLLFVLTFCELNLLKHKLSLIELLQRFYPELDLETNKGSLNVNDVWFVLDGLDDYSLSLNYSCPIVTDISEVSTVDILVTNLIMGNLLSNAHVWITSRCAEASQIPNRYLLKETEVQCFSDEYREQHFRTVAGNDDLATKAIGQVKVSRSLESKVMHKNFQMQVSMRCDERLLSKLPAVMESRTAMLQFSNLTDKCCPALAAVLSTRESHLRKLDLGYNSISDDGVRTVVEGLNNQNCRLKTLRLQGCGVTSEACKYLATALTQSLKLRELDLSGNDIGDDGLQYLSSGLECLECHLDTLKLSQCNIEQKGCYHLASALQKNPSHLRVLDLSINMVGDNGANELLKKFDISKLRKLEVYYCGLTVLSCRNIAEALKSESSTLTELNLSSNNLKNAGFALICEGMYAWCRLEKLNVSRCGITGFGCIYLAKVLCSVSQLYSREFLQETDWQAVELRDLDLRMNFLGDTGVQEISDGLKNPYSHLKTVNLSHCNLTHDCCAELASGIASEESVISELDLSGNDLQDKGVHKLCVGLRSPLCKLEVLSLRMCGLSSKSVQFLTAALKSNPDYLTELLLMGNRLEESDIRVLVELTTNQKYSLDIIDVSAD